jgi:hypothetical protein
LGTLVGEVLTAGAAALMMKAEKSKEAEELSSRLFDRELDAINSASPSKGAKELVVRLFPAQVTLSLGSICGAVVPVAAGWV